MNTLIMNAAIHFALVCFILALGCAAIRLIRGPTAEDRVLALDTLYVDGMLVLLALGLKFDAGSYFDVALLIALLGFAGSAALARFLLRGEIIEP